LLEEAVGGLEHVGCGSREQQHVVEVGEAAGAVELVDFFERVLELHLAEVEGVVCLGEQSGP